MLRSVRDDPDRRQDPRKVLIKSFKSGSFLFLGVISVADIQKFKVKIVYIYRQNA